ncbi:O-antigen/teichoic acid export membrane protein [Gillisia mitskevichiae]|uniref:O-antigen/teichoic acid export membrane protein n=2 Tax=Gillisia mitskevichiae TaxID=270921 RepID=A0A495PL60_9FLAO|nr:O-antigen/teichoic acid export membrane protein [Gillisia mitskevichiae]
MKFGIGTVFTISSLFKTFSGMAISLFALSIIGPEKIGLWHAALILKPYLGFAQLGLTEGLGRELPFYMGKNRGAKVKRYVANAQIVTLMYTLVSILLTLLLTFLVAEGIEEKMVFVTAGVFISTMFVDNYLSSTYRSTSSFQDLSRVYIYSAIIGLLLIPLIYYYDFRGYMWLLLVHSLISTILLVYFRPFKLKSKFDKLIYMATVKTGFPMLALNFLRSIPETYPKILIIFFISTTALGLTAPANAALMAFGVLPAALAKYFYPTITYQYGKDGNRYNLWLKIKQISGYLLLLGLAGLISLTIIPYAIENFFPKYAEAVYITMLAVGIGFLRMYSILYNVFNTLKSYRAQFKVSMTRNILYLIIPSVMYFMDSKEDSLVMIFSGLLIAEFISTLVMIYFLYQVTHIKKS